MKSASIAPLRTVDVLWSCLFRAVWVTEIGAVATDWVTGGKDVHTIFVIPIGGIWIIG